MTKRACFLSGFVVSFSCQCLCFIISLPGSDGGSIRPLRVGQGAIDRRPILCVCNNWWNSNNGCQVGVYVWFRSPSHIRFSCSKVLL